MVTGRVPPLLNVAVTVSACVLPGVKLVDAGESATEVTVGWDAV